MRFYAAKAGWRRRAIAGFLRLRPALAEHTEGEGRLLRHYARDARRVVELGVAEGTSAWEMHQVMGEGCTLVLVDPHRGYLGMSFAGRVARRLLARSGPGRVRWVRGLSHEAAKEWHEPIDFLFIDADHSYQGVSGDWRDWARHVVPGGHVALHDARVIEGWTTPETGPVRLVGELSNDPTWEQVEAVDSMVVLRRRD